MKYLFGKTFSCASLSISLFILVSTSSCRSHKEFSKTETDNKIPNSRSVQEKYSQILNVDKSNIENIKLYSFVDDWYGVSYKYGGKTKSGIDCSNFCTLLYNSVYSKTLSGTSSSIFEKCDVVSKKNLEEGDLLFFKIDGDNISHIGVYLQNNKFVHATTKKGVMIDDLDEDYYKKYFYKAGRIRK
ncbi:MAG: NlpC/P60 family protein [Bacteroidetes bacterium]|nr:NlpC/P60 family protein [Bacteroidota bacterium]